MAKKKLQWKVDEAKSEDNWVLMSTLPLACCVTLGK